MTTDGIEQPSPELPRSAPAAPLEADTAQPKPAARSLTTYLGLAFDFFLIGLIVVGIYFRFSWLNWSQGADLHPDEYGLTATLTRLSIPDTLTAYFNTRLSSISPYQKYDEEGFPTVSGPDNRMRWGQWPIIIIRLTAELTNNAD